VIMLVSDS